MFKHCFLYLSVIFAFLFTSCGGGGDSTPAAPTEYQGVFKDARVEGLKYSTSSGRSGVTDVNGAYTYIAGDTVTFSVGDIVLGQTNATALVTPMSLVGVSDPANATVLNIARFLQTLDDDNDSSVVSGITITSAVSSKTSGVSINFEQSTSAFEADTNVLTAVLDLTNARTSGPRSLVSSSEAEAHLRATMDDVFLQALHDYSGSSSNTLSKCTDPSQNRTTVASGTLSLNSYSSTSGGATVSGSASFTSNVQGHTVREDFVFSGVAINFLGEISGSSTNSAYVDGSYSGSGSSSFTGMLNGDSISIKYPTVINRNMGYGIYCDVSGASISVSR